MPSIHHGLGRDNYPPSEKTLTASMFLCLPRYASVTSGEPSLIIRCTVIKLLKTTVHVESRSRCCNALNTSPTPASPACVATRICSMYFVLGGAAYERGEVGSRSVTCFSLAAPSDWGQRGRCRRRNRQTHLYLGRAFHGLLKRARHD